MQALRALENISFLEGLTRGTTSPAQELRPFLESRLSQLVAGLTEASSLPKPTLLSSLFVWAEAEKACWAVSGPLGNLKDQGLRLVETAIAHVLDALHDSTQRKQYSELLRALSAVELLRCDLSQWHSLGLKSVSRVEGCYASAMKCIEAALRDFAEAAAAHLRESELALEDSKIEAQALMEHFEAFKGARATVDQLLEQIESGPWSVSGSFCRLLLEGEIGLRALQAVNCDFASLCWRWLASCVPSPHTAVAVFTSNSPLPLRRGPVSPQLGDMAKQVRKSLSATVGDLLASAAKAATELAGRLANPSYDGNLLGKLMDDGQALSIKVGPLG